MVKFDFWYGNTLKEVTKADCFFYPNDGEYRGNLYINDKAVGDYVSNDSVELEEAFQNR